jgi:hypothetical protein
VGIAKNQCSVARSRSSRQDEGESGALVGSGDDVDAAAVEGHHFADDGEADAGAGLAGGFGAAGAVELAEQVLLFREVHADALVLDGNAGFSVHGLAADLHL